MCTGKFLKWLGLTSINHQLIERLKQADTVSRQECEALHISEEVIRVLVYCGIVEEVIQVISQVQIKAIKLKDVS